MESLSVYDRFAVKYPDRIQLYSADFANGMKVAACLQELVDLRSHEKAFDYEVVSNLFLLSTINN